MPLSEPILRPWRHGDLDDLIRLGNNINIWRQLRDLFPHPYTREAGERWLEIAVAPDPTVFVIEYDGQFAGGIGYHPGRDIDRCSAEVGYWVGESFWGKGIATRAIELLIKKAKDRNGLTRLFAVPFASNSASRRVLGKNGFTLDALLRQAAIKEGQIRDVCLYSFLLHE